MELGAALTNDMGLPVTFVYIDDVTDALTRLCDCVMEVSPSEAQNFEVGCAYASNAVGIFGTGEPRLLSASDLEGATVAVQEGSFAEAALDATALVCNKLPVPSIREAFDALTSGSCDYVFGNVVSCAYLASTLPDVTFVGVLTEPVSVGVAVPGGEDPVSHEVYASFERLSQNGVLAETRRRWMGDVGMVGADSLVQDVPMIEVEPEPEPIGNVDGDGTGAGSNAVTIASMRTYR